MTSKLEERVKRLEIYVKEQEEALHICLDLIDGLDNYCTTNLKTSTPPQLQKKWDTDRVRLLKLAKQHVKSKKGGKRGTKKRSRKRFR